MGPHAPSTAAGRVRVIGPALVSAVLLMLSGCGANTPSAHSVSSGDHSRPVPAGWNSFLDPDHGWFTGYPGGWVVFAQANTSAWKNFVSNDARIDLNSRSFRLQRGDGLLTIGVDKPASCIERTEEPGETHSATAIAGRDVDIYHWSPPTSAGVPASEYAVRAVVNDQCYSIFLLFIAVPTGMEQSVVQGVTASFQFATS